MDRPANSFPAHGFTKSLSAAAIAFDTMIRIYYDVAIVAFRKPDSQRRLLPVPTQASDLLLVQLRQSKDLVCVERESKIGTDMFLLNQFTRIGKSH